MADVAHFILGQRVHAVLNDAGMRVNRIGTVYELRGCDDGAWIELDEPMGNVQFVLVYPKDCKEVPLG
jgi:hypothetical protein